MEKFKQYQRGNMAKNDGCNDAQPGKRKKMAETIHRVVVKSKKEEK